ncbi:hypothetical protein WJX72_009968 [[Myrmecia] bisecta]|uniref:Uncharacterized protein n=1 Tax=[Myrmecia] bisecta TaxID=41462 RepID=A0AAW1QT04_9CHLO
MTTALAAWEGVASKPQDGTEITQGGCEAQGPLTGGTLKAITRLDRHHVPWLLYIYGMSRSMADEYEVMIKQMARQGARIEVALAAGTSIVPCKTLCRALRRGQEPEEYCRAELERAVHPGRPTMYDCHISHYFPFLRHAGVHAIQAFNQADEELMARCQAACADEGSVFILSKDGDYLAAGDEMITDIRFNDEDQVEGLVYTQDRVFTSREGYTAPLQSLCLRHLQMVLYTVGGSDWQVYRLQGYGIKKLLKPMYKAVKEWIDSGGDAEEMRISQYEEALKLSLMEDGRQELLEDLVKLGCHDYDELRANEGPLDVKLSFHEFCTANQQVYQVQDDEVTGTRCFGDPTDHRLQPYHSQIPKAQGTLLPPGTPAETLRDIVSGKCRPHPPHLEAAGVDLGRMRVIAAFGVSANSQLRVHALRSLCLAARRVLEDASFESANEQLGDAHDLYGVISIQTRGLDALNIHMRNRSIGMQSGSLVLEARASEADIVVLLGETTKQLLYYAALSWPSDCRALLDKLHPSSRHDVILEEAQDVFAGLLAALVATPAFREILDDIFTCGAGPASHIRAVALAVPVGMGKAYRFLVSHTDNLLRSLGMDADEDMEMHSCIAVSGIVNGQESAVGMLRLAGHAVAATLRAVVPGLEGHHGLLVGYDTDYFLHAMGVDAACMAAVGETVEGNLSALAERSASRPNRVAAGTCGEEMHLMVVIVRTVPCPEGRSNILGRISLAHAARLAKALGRPGAPRHLLLVAEDELGEIRRIGDLRTTQGRACGDHSFLHDMGEYVVLSAHGVLLYVQPGKPYLLAQRLASADEAEDMRRKITEAQRAAMASAGNTSLQPCSIPVVRLNGLQPLALEAGMSEAHLLNAIAPPGARLLAVVGGHRPCVRKAGARRLQQALAISDEDLQRGVVKLVAHHALGALLIGSLYSTGAQICIKSFDTSIATATRAIGERPWVVTADPFPHGEFMLAVRSLAGAGASPGELEDVLDNTLKKCNLRLSSIAPEHLERLQHDMQTEAAANLHKQISPQVLPPGHAPILAGIGDQKLTESAMDMLLELAGEDYTLEIAAGAQTLPIYMGATGKLPKEEGELLVHTDPTGLLHLSRALGAGERQAASRLIRLFGELEAWRKATAQLAEWQRDAEQAGALVLRAEKAPACAEGERVPVATLKIRGKAKFQAPKHVTRCFLDVVPEADEALIRSDRGMRLVCKMDVPDTPGGKLVCASDGLYNLT